MRSQVRHGFIYNTATQTWTTIDAPGATNTRLYEMENGYIVGQCTLDGASKSFLYDGTTWFYLEGGPGIESRLGISGDIVVGSYAKTYYGENGAIGFFVHGFTYTIPEPATLLLLGISGLIVKRK